MIMIIIMIMIMKIMKWQPVPYTFLLEVVLMDDLELVEVEEHGVERLADGAIQLDVRWQLTARVILQLHRQFHLTLEAMSTFCF
jgi:hypothetical protein